PSSDPRNARPRSVWTRSTVPETGEPTSRPATRIERPPWEASTCVGTTSRSSAPATARRSPSRLIARRSVPRRATRAGRACAARRSWRPPSRSSIATCCSSRRTCPRRTRAAVRSTGPAASGGARPEGSTPSTATFGANGASLPPQLGDLDLPALRRAVANHVAARQLDDAVGHARDLAVVGHDQDGPAGMSLRVQELEDLDAGVKVELAGGL